MKYDVGSVVQIRGKEYEIVKVVGEVELRGDELVEYTEIELRDLSQEVMLPTHVIKWFDDKILLLKIKYIKSVLSFYDEMLLKKEEIELIS